MLGVPVEVHVTLIIAFLLIAGTLSIGFMPVEYPGRPVQTYLAMGILGALLLFGSVLVHELAHSYVALRKGVKVRRIILFIFGGVSEMSEEPKSPSFELVIALVGPLTSFALAGIFGAMWYITRLLGEYVVLEAALRYGSYINLLLGGFNLIPAFPMDGGRVLRAGIWSKTKDHYRATLMASRVGMAFAYVLIAIGLLLTFSGSLLGGIWLIFIGWFLKSATESGLTQTMISEALSTVMVNDVMTTTVHTVHPECNLKDVVENHFLVYKHGGFPVVANGDVLGIVTLSDVRKVSKERWEQTLCKDVMTPSHKLVFLRPEDPAAQALLLMSQHNVGRLIVQKDGKLAGIVSRSDIMKTVRAKMALRT